MRTKTRMSDATTNQTPTRQWRRMMKDDDDDNDDDDDRTRMRTRTRKIQGQI